MARVFITGSADGLGLMAGQILLEQGHEVMFHARAAGRPSLKGRNVAVGDVSTLAAMKSVAEQANASGPFDAIIHNVAIGYQEPGRVETEDGLEKLFAINTLAPYVLTALMPRPKRLVFLTSGLHQSGETHLDDLLWKKRRWSGMQAYSDSKLHDVLLAFYFARKWSEVLSNAVEPGWVATKMGGRGAPDDLSKGPVTQAWLAVSSDASAQQTGKVWFHQKPIEANADAHDVKLQDGLVAKLAEMSGIALR